MIENLGTGDGLGQDRETRTGDGEGGMKSARDLGRGHHRGDGGREVEKGREMAIGSEGEMTTENAEERTTTDREAETESTGEGEVGVDLARLMPDGDGVIDHELVK